MSQSDFGVQLRVFGDYACFTRPEMKVERVSYDVMTPSAARGVLEAILWKPEFRWVIDRIDVLAPVRWFSIRRNEVKNKIARRGVQAAMKTGRGALEIAADDSDERVQRASLLLRDVDYVIHAHIEARDTKNPPIKYRDMFRRRAEKGQCFHRPYLGCREFAASFEVADDTTSAPIDDTRELGLMLLDIDYADPATPKFFQATLERGRLAVPRIDASEGVV